MMWYGPAISPKIANSHHLPFSASAFSLQLFPLTLHLFPASPLPSFRSFSKPPRPAARNVRIYKPLIDD